MKETLEEAAREELIHSYSNKYNGNGTFEYGQEVMLNMFRKGAEWQAKQSPWISVNEQLPEESLINPSAWSVTYKVFVLTSNRNASISQRRWNCNTNRWEWKESGSLIVLLTGCQYPNSHEMPLRNLI